MQNEELLSSYYAGQLKLFLVYFNWVKFIL